MDSPTVSNVVRKVLFRDSVQFCSDLVDLVVGVSCRVAVSSVPDAWREILIASRRPLALQVFTAIENLLWGAAASTSTAGSACLGRRRLALSKSDCGLNCIHNLAPAANAVVTARAAAAKKDDGLRFELLGIRWIVGGFAC